MSVFQVSLDELHARLACLSCYHMVGKTKQTVQRQLNIFTRHRKGRGGEKKKDVMKGETKSLQVLS